MKFANRLKFTATGTSAATITFSAAVTGFRTLAQVISDDASDPLGIKVGDTGIAFVIDDGAGNEEFSLFTVTSSTVLTRTAVLTSTAGGTTPATFTGATLSVFNSMPASLATRLIYASVDTLGNFVGLKDPKGNDINLIARLLANANTPAAPAVEKTFKSLEIGVPIYGNNTNGGQRIVYSEGKRRLVRFKNPSTNTVPLELGYRFADNIQNANNSYPTTKIIIPVGGSIVVFFDNCQYWMRQYVDTAVDGQTVTIEREARV